MSNKFDLSFRFVIVSTLILLLLRLFHYMLSLSKLELRYIDYKFLISFSNAIFNDVAAPNSALRKKSC